jgi:hypothetical protein
MTGAENVPAQEIPAFVPGSMAEHLTSLAGAFHVVSQTKLSVWIRAGASASTGAVVEPLANWRKFPNAWFYVHQAAGCTILESLYQSIRCPLQLLMIGDPLAQPWRPEAKLVLKSAAEPAATGSLEAQVEVKSEPGHRYGKVVYLLDGRVIGQGASLKYDPGREKAGEHTLRAVAYRTGMVRSQVFAEQKIALRERR